MLFYTSHQKCSLLKLFFLSNQYSISQRCSFNGKQIFVLTSAEKFALKKVYKRVSQVRKKFPFKGFQWKSKLRIQMFLRQTGI